MTMKTRTVLASIALALVACATTEPSTPSPGAAVTDPSRPTDAQLAAPTAGFAIHVVRRFGAEPTIDDPDGAWPRFLASAPLDEVVLTDADLESIATAPLTLVLTTAGGRALRARVGDVPEHRFVVTLGGARLFAGRMIFVGTARALHHPVIHLDDSGFAVKVAILPTLGARADTAVNAPPALLAHFADAGKLLPPGAVPTPRFVRRTWAAEATNTKPGDPTSRVAATCEAAACTLELAFRHPGSAAGTWDQRETLALDRADFDAVWTLVERHHLVRLDPRPTAGPDRVIHAPRYRVAVSGDRGDGDPVALDRAWSTPSSSDSHARGFLVAAGALGRRLARDVPVRYFPE